jgi:hypothetical protein
LLKINELHALIVPIVSVVALGNDSVIARHPDDQWVQEVRFAIEGVTQGIVGLAGLVGKLLLLLCYSWIVFSD